MPHRLRIKKSTIHTLFKWMSVFVIVNYSVGAVLLSSFVVPQKIVHAAMLARRFFYNSFMLL